MSSGLAAYRSSSYLSLRHHPLVACRLRSANSLTPIRIPRAGYARTWVTGSSGADRPKLLPYRRICKNRSALGTTRDHSFANTPLAQHPFGIRQCRVPIGLRHSSRITCRNYRIENYNHVLILILPPRTSMGRCPAHIVDFPTISLPDCDSGFRPRRPCKKYLPGPFPLSPRPRVQYRWCWGCRRRWVQIRRL